jgi:CRP-like cAMP-binding protein
MLSIIDRIIFLKEVPFFQSMTIPQLKVIAAYCEEKLYEKDAHIFQKGDPGGVLYIVVNGRVGIEQEKRHGSFARLADINAYASFGEADFFDNSQRTTSAVAVRDTLILELRREPMIELAKQNPNLTLELINVLSQRLRDSADRVADLTRSQPRALNKLYDQFD